MSDGVGPKRVLKTESQQERPGDDDDVQGLQKELRKANRTVDALLGTSGLSDASTKEISDYVLASIVSLTDSPYGFYGFVNEDETLMKIYSWSGDVMSDCAMVDKPTDFPVAEAGVWAEAIRNRQPLILNDYSLEDPRKKGLPKGHVTLTRLLVVPFFRDEKIDAVVAVANRNEDYTQQDVDELSAFLKNIQMIIDNQRTREALRSSEERYRLINDASRDAIYSYNLESRFTFANSYMCALLQMTPDEIIGKTQAELGLPKEHCDKWDAVHKEVIENDASVTTVTESPMPDGTLRHCEVILGPLHDEAGQTIGICGTTRDFTELQRVQREKDELEQKYLHAQKMESVGRLAGGIAHDLNNMLSPVLGYAELIADDLKTGAVQPHMVDNIIGAATRTRDLIQRLLAFSRKQVMTFEPVVFDEMMAGFEPLLRGVLREDIVLEFNLRAHSAHVLGDRVQLEQVIMNLVVNAQDAMPQGGTLTVATSIEEDASSRAPGLKGSKAGRCVVLTIEDTGHGMEELILDKLFEPFFTTKEVGKGTGLGLAMVYGIVKQHGGTVWVSSDAGQGAVFGIGLRVYSGEAESRREPAAVDKVAEVLERKN